MSNSTTCEWTCDLCGKIDTTSRDVDIPYGWEKVWLVKARQAQKTVQKDEIVWGHDFDLCLNCYPGENAIREQPEETFCGRKHSAMVRLLRRIVGKKKTPIEGDGCD